jgi:hypothetical protein
MPYFPLKFKKGKNYKIYIESKGKEVASKAHVIQLALEKALKDETHITEIDFIPVSFTLQLHGWTDKESDEFRNCKKMKAFVMKQIKLGKDPARVLEKKGMGKWHYDLRILKLSASTWFGATLFSAPWLATAEKKSLGSAKGIQITTKEGKKTTKWLGRVGKDKGFKERADKLFWMNVICGYWAPGSVANPTKNQYAYMIRIDFGRGVLHRREPDFTDFSLYGNLLKGRYFNRLVKRKTEKGSKINFYFWKAAKGEFEKDLMLKVAKGDIELSPIETAKK